MNGRRTFADLVKAAEQKEKPKFELVEKSAQPTPPTLNPPDSRDVPLSSTIPPGSQINLKPIAPEKDFAKVANSIVREVVAGGLFIGKSKQIYDYLYSQTRGAITPRRKVRITKTVLMRSAGIGSERTLQKNLGHLKTIGLIEITPFEGEHAGNEYEVFLPEEIDNPPHPPHPPHPLQKVGGVPPAESGVGGVGSIVENTITYANPKTSLKTLKNDDEKERLSDVLALFDEAAKRATGKGLTDKDLEALREIAEIIISETDLARARTKSISVYLKFAAANLRRRLYSRTTERVSKKPFDPGKQSPAIESELEVVEELSNETRQIVLHSLRDMSQKNGSESIEFFKNNYTSEDWNWLMNNLEKESRPTE